MSRAKQRIQELEHELAVSKEWWYENKDDLPNEVSRIFFSGVCEQTQRRNRWMEIEGTRSRFQQTSI